MLLFLAIFVHFHRFLNYQTGTVNKRNASFIGGLAVIRWGEVRMTQDIDLSLFTEFGNEETYINSLLEKISHHQYNWWYEEGP
nr:hypothetical protein GZ18F2_20 [uncultured archaeon GZfos18F2]